MKSINISNTMLLVASLCTVSLPLKAVKRNNERPNVVFIYADDLGRGLLSHYGQKIISTPNIDRLFKKGTAFEYAYGCMFSAPARASMLTGYNDCRQGKWNISNGGMLININGYADLEAVESQLNRTYTELDTDDLLLPQVFKKAGYVTGQFGKLDWGFTATRQQIRKHGWDYYCGYLDHQHAHVFYPYYLFENDSILYIPQNTHPMEGRGFELENSENYKKRWDMRGKEIYSQDIFLDRMLSFIRNNQNRPFFLYHSTQLPHGPVAIPEVHFSVKNRTDLSDIEKEYASMVLMLDRHVGIIIEELEKLNMIDNTIIVFSADNGHETYYTTGNRCAKSPNRDMQGKQFDAWDYPYRSNLAGDPFNGNDGFSGKKWMNWEGSVRVPLVFCWNRRIPAGKTLKQVVANYDLISTFADLLGVKLTTTKDGVSILPVLTGGKKKLKKERFVFLNSPEGPAVVTSEHWKLRYNKQRKEYRLHYLPKDYCEETFLNDRYPKVFEKLKKELEYYINQ